MKKGFYASLAVGVIAIAAVGIIAAQNTGSQEMPEHLAQMESAPKTTQAPEIQKEPQEEIQGTQPQVNLPAESKEPVKVPETKVEKEPVKTPEKEIEKTSSEKKAEPEKAPEVSQVMTGAGSVKKLSFKEEEGLIWPVIGDVLLKYSMDKSIYFKTLAQYKLSPAMVIAAKADSEVLSAAKCVVTDISENEETGLTLTAELGNDYEVVYGQLKDVKAKVGDTIEKGSVIGKIAEPTKYYIEEGSNLYFKVLEGGKPVDPMLLLE